MGSVVRPTSREVRGVPSVDPLQGGTEGEGGPLQTPGAPLLRVRPAEVRGPGIEVVPEVGVLGRSRPGHPGPLRRPPNPTHGAPDRSALSPVRGGWASRTGGPVLTSDDGGDVADGKSVGGETGQNDAAHFLGRDRGGGPLRLRDPHQTTLTYAARRPYTRPLLLDTRVPSSSLHGSPPRTLRPVISKPRIPNPSGPSHFPEDPQGFIVPSHPVPTSAEDTSPSC